MNNHASLNRHYRLVWSDHQQAYVVAAENARGRGKSAVSSMGGAVFAGLLALSSPFAMAAPPAVTQLPTGGSVVAGQAVITQAGARMDVQQASPKAIVEWGTFNIGSQAQVNFNQPSASAVMLNRVLDSNPSQIYGHLNATGQVFFVNPNGMYFAPGASVDVGGLVASTHRLADADFMAGNYRFTRDGATGQIINKGNLTAALGGYIALLAPEVRNEGVIVAQAGTVALASGEAMTLNFAADSLAGVSVDPSTISALVENKQAVIAPGGRIILSAHAADRLQGGVVKNSGTLEASGMVRDGGEVFLTASDSIVQSGSIRADAAPNSSGNGGKVVVFADLDKGSVTELSGTISARGGNVGGKGGFVETSGSTVNVADSAFVDTRAANGATGEWLIDPYNITVAATGGNITGAALATALGGSNVTLDTTNTTATNATYSSTPASGIGDITITDAVTKTGASHTTLTLKAHNDININAAISSSSSSGGRLNVALTADQDNSDGTTSGGSVTFGSTGSVTTNSGNFYVGSVNPGYNGSTSGNANYADAVTATAANFTMAAGSFVDVGSGLVNIKVTNTATLTGDGTHSGLRVSGYGNAYNIGGTQTYYSASYTSYPTQSSVTINAVSIQTNNVDATRPDIVTAGDTALTAGTIGGSGAGSSIKISGQNADAANSRVTTGFRTLTLANSLGNTYVSEIGNQVFGTVSLQTGSQTNSTHNIQIMSDAGGNGTTGTGHIIATTDGAGLLNIASGGIDTSGNAGASANWAVSSSTVFPTSVSLSNASIAFADNAVYTGPLVTAFTAGFTASGNLTGTSGGATASSGADIRSNTISLSGGSLGTAANPVELGAGTTLTVTNSGTGAASTYLRAVDNTFSTISISTYQTAGTHELLFSTGDHINFRTDGSKIIVGTIGVRSNGTTFATSSGIDLSGALAGVGRDFTLMANSGDIQFGDNSVNTGSKSFTASIYVSNTAGSIYSANDYDVSTKVAQITAGDVGFKLYATAPTGSIGAVNKNIQFAQGGSAATNTLTVIAGTGAVNIHELTANHIKTVNMTLNGNPAAQNVAIDFNSTHDDISFADSGTLITFDATKINLIDNNRNWYFAAPYRNVQIDSNSVGTGYYHVGTGTPLKLNGNIATNDGTIYLAGSRIDLMKSVSITSNSDHLGTLTNADPVYGSYGIYLSGALSGTADGYTLSLDSSSTNAAGSNINMYSAAGNTGGGSYLGGLSMTSKGSTNTNDGIIYLQGASYNLKGDFSATGYTYLYAYGMVIDTEQGNTANGGSISFAGQNLTYVYTNAALTFDTSTTFTSGNGGAINLAGTYSKDTITANWIAATATGGASGTGGVISLPAVTTNNSGTASTQAYTGSTINLYGNLSSNWGNITLAGSTVLQNSVTIDTWSGTSTTINGSQTTQAAGTVTLNGTGVSAVSTGKVLTIDTSTSTGSGYSTGTTDWQHSGGAVSVLSAGNAGGQYLDSLIVTTTKGGTHNTASNGTLTLGGAIQTTTAQTYTGPAVSIAGNLTSGTITFDTTATSGLTQSLANPYVISATALLLKGSGTNYNFNTTSAGHQVGTLAATGAGTLNFINATALTLGTVGATNGLSASGTINVATRGGDLTIAKNVTSTNATDSAVYLNAGLPIAYSVATGGNIVISGTPTITTGTEGRAKLFTGSVAGSTGLTTLVGSGSGRFRYNSDESEGGTRYTSALGSGVYAIYREQPTVTATVNNQAITYGQALPTFTFTLAGAVNGDISSQAFTVQPTISVGGLQSTSGNYVAGSHLLSASGGTSGLGYGLTLDTSTTANLVVSQKPLTATATASNKIYNGDTSATINTSTKALATGVLTNDVVTLATISGTGTFASKNVANGIAVDLAGLTLSGADSSNYTVTGVGGASANITPYAASLTGTRVYNGSANVDAGIFTLGTLVGTETLMLTGTGTVASKNAGNAKTVTLGTLALANGSNGGLSSNYTFTGGTQTANVTPYATSLTGARVYNGSANVDAGIFTLGTLVGTETLTLTGTGTVASKNVGNGKTVTVGPLAVANGSNGGLGSNYTFTGGTQTANVTPYAVSMSGNRAYDGSATVAAGIFTLGTLVGSETLTLTGTGTVASKDVGNGKTVTLGALELANGSNGGLSSNYTFTGGTQIAAITPYAVSLSGSRAYDGAVTVDAGIFTIGTLIGSETLGLSGTATVDSKDAGTGKAVNSAGLALTNGNNGGLASNYAINDRTGLLAINTIPLLVTANSDSKSYNGIPYSGGNGVTYAGFITTETSLVLGGTLTYTGTAQGAINVGEYVMTAGGYTSNNYALRYVDGQLRINQVPVVLPPPIATTTQAVIQPVQLVTTAPGVAPPPSAVPKLPEPVVIVAPIARSVAPGLVAAAAAPVAAGPTVSLSGGFVAVVPIDGVVVPSGQGEKVIQLPTEIFSHSASDAKLVVAATLDNGLPLPSWIKFDSATSRLTVTPGQGNAGTLKIKINAVDAEGGAAATVLELNVSGQSEAAPAN